jgi:hypothetical protein
MFRTARGIESGDATLTSLHGWGFNLERTMSPRIFLIALLAAFGFAALFATLTTVRQIHIQTSAVSEPLHRG